MDWLNLGECHPPHCSHDGILLQRGTSNFEFIIEPFCVNNLYYKTFHRYNDKEGVDLDCFWSIASIKSSCEHAPTNEKTFRVRRKFPNFHDEYLSFAHFSLEVPMGASRRLSNLYRKIKKKSEILRICFVVLR